MMKRRILPIALVMSLTLSAIGVGGTAYASSTPSASTPLPVQTKLVATPSAHAYAVGGWTLDPNASTGAETLELVQGWVHFKSTSSNGNATSNPTATNAYPAMAVNDQSFDFSMAGAFHATVKSPQDGSVNRFGFYLGYKTPGDGLFIGYDSGGWFWQRYVAGGGTWYSGSRVAAPAANAEVNIEVSWTAAKVATLSVDGRKAFDVDYSSMTALSDKIAIKAGSWPSLGQVTDAYLTGFGPGAQTKYRISGKILDAKGAPISGVTVSAAGATAITGADGTFTIADVLPGTRTLTVFKSGYQKVTKTITVNNSDVLVGNIALNLAPYTVTTGTIGPWGYPDDTPASPFIDKNGTFYFSQAHALYGASDSRKWSFYTGSSMDNAKPDTALNASGTNGNTTALCNSSPTGTQSTTAPSPSGYAQPNYCDLTQIWVDPDTGDWYGLVHNEFTPQPFGDGLHYDAIDYAISHDQGKTWAILNHAITSPYSTVRGDTQAFPQNTYYYGDGDPRLYVDTASGYFYVFYGSRVVNKGGSWVAFHEHVARAPISGKMAAGSWQKWYDGSWSQPGIGGKESNMVPVNAGNPNGYTPAANEYNPKTPGTAQQQIANGQMPATSPLFVMDITYNAYLGLYIGEPQNPDQSGNAPQEFYATKSLATQQWFLLGDSGSGYTTASWYRWFLDPATATNTAIVGKSFRSYCSFACANNASGNYANITIGALSPASLVDTTAKYHIAAGNGLMLAQASQGTGTTTTSNASAANASWTFVSNGDGSYAVKNAVTGGLLGVGSTAPTSRAWGAATTVNAAAGSPDVGQQWFLMPNTSSSTGASTGTFRLVNRYSGLMLGLSPGNSAATVPGRSWNSTTSGATVADAMVTASAQMLTFTKVTATSNPPTEKTKAPAATTPTNSKSSNAGIASANTLAATGAEFFPAAVMGLLLLIAGGVMGLLRGKHRVD